jgi:glycosyltransferase involved in cell wall biosynthesis
MQRARAFIFAAEEDFGITPVERACGTPVIATAAAARSETIRGLDHDRPTGLFFQRQWTPLPLPKPCPEV